MNKPQSLWQAIHEDIDNILEKDPAARTRLEICLVYSGFHARTLHRLSHGLWHHNFRSLARILAHFTRWLTGIEIHPAATIGRRLFIDHGMGIVIGETAEIGDDVTLYHGVTLGGVSWEKGTKRHPTLENGVIVGAGAKILGSFTVGAHSKIGSNAVVIKPVPPHSTMIGSAARMVIKDKPKQETDFDSYGLKKNTEDPVLQSINRLCLHIQEQDKQIALLQAALERIDPHFKKIEHQPLQEDVKLKDGL